MATTTSSFARDAMGSTWTTCFTGTFSRDSFLLLQGFLFHDIQLPRFCITLLHRWTIRFFMWLVFMFISRFIFFVVFHHPKSGTNATAIRAYFMQ